MGKIIKPAILMILMILCVAVPRAYSLTYAIDDGTGEGGVGVAQGPANIIWANRFAVVPGAEMITAISAAFGPLQPIVSLNGVPVTASLWSDPNGDGLPNDAVLLSSVGGTVANFGTNIFNVYNIPDTVVSGYFFVAVSLVDPGNDAVPAREDTDSTPTQSFLGFFTSNLQGALPNEVQLVDASWMIRAEGSPVAPVPEPATMLLLGSGLIGLVGYGRRLLKK
jgi:hypothetical protein